MKKLTAFVLALVLALSLVACGGKASSGSMVLEGDKLEVAEVEEFDGGYREYDKDGRLLRAVYLRADGSEESVTESFYKKGVLVGSRSTLYDETGAVMNIHETFYQKEGDYFFSYDADRNLLSYGDRIYNKDGYVSTTYDADGNIITKAESILDSDTGNTVYRIFDGDGVLVSETLYDSSWNIISMNENDPNAEWLDDNTKKTTYDWGEEIEYFDADKQRIKKELYSDGVLNAAYYFDPGEYQPYKYESYWDGVLYYTDEYEYVEVGGEMLESRVKSTDAETGDYDITTYEYDSEGRILRRSYEDTAYGSSYTDTYEYDANGNITLKVHDDSDSSRSYTESYEYDAKGNVLKHAKESADPYETFTEVYTYNSEGLVVEMRHDGSYGYTVTTEYNSDDKPIKIETVYDDSSKEFYEAEYHSNGETKKETYILADKTFSTTYDENGNLVMEESKDSFVGYTCTRYENGLQVEYINESLDGSYQYRAEYEYYSDGSMKTVLEYEEGTLKSRTDYSSDGISTVTEYN